jgi:single-strand DNA-binding protein
MLNKVLLIGRMTKDPELKYTPSNVAVVSFTIAVDRKYQVQGEERKADFIPCVAWRSTAEFIAKYFTKGQMINVCGALQVRSWEDTQGNRKWATEVYVDEVNFCGDKQKDPLDDVVNAIGGTQYPPQGFAPVDADEDLPF